MEVPGLGALGEYNLRFLEKEMASKSVFHRMDKSKKWAKLAATWYFPKMKMAKGRVVSY